MRKKLAIVILALVCVATAAALGRAVGKSKRSKASPTQARHIPELAILQIREKDGRVPVEIIDAKYNDAGLSFAVRNNTPKPIDAVVVIITGKVLKPDGKESGFQVPVKWDYSAANAHHAWMKPKKYGEQFRFFPEPFEPEGRDKVQSLTIHVSFVDFTDKTSLGPDTLITPKQGTAFPSSDLISAGRSGGRKYQEWFDNLPNDDAKKAALKEKELPADIPFTSDLEQAAAKKQRNHILNHQHK